MGLLDAASSSLSSAFPPSWTSPHHRRPCTAPTASHFYCMARADEALLGVLLVGLGDLLCARRKLLPAPSRFRLCGACANSVLLEVMLVALAAALCVSREARIFIAHPEAA